jgi:Primosomal protein N'' (replication factor Y) - superfamily II helicase
VYCQVIVDIVHENVASPFTYRVPAGMPLERGQRVAVPFRHSEKEGIVLSLSEDCDLDGTRIREVIRPLEPYAAVPEELMLLAEQMSEEIHCPMAETLRLMLPAQMRGGRIHTKTEATARLAVSAREALDAAARCEKRSPKKAWRFAIKSENTRKGSGCSALSMR